MRIIFLFGILGVVLGCGIKGDPLPPAEQETIQAAQDIPAPAPIPSEADLKKKKKKWL